MTYLELRGSPNGDVGDLGHTNIYRTGAVERGSIHEAWQGQSYRQRGEPSTSDLPDGECMVYESDGTGTGAAGDLIYAVNDAGTIKTSILAAKSNAT
jgi:hypothetical protein